MSEEELTNGLGEICLFELFVDHINGTEADKELFQSLDLDNDGKLDYSEFLQAAINHQALLNKENILEIFKMFDVNGDGYISKEELQFVFKSQHGFNASEQFLMEIMEDVDKNKDNQISFEEFNEGLCSILNKDPLDTKTDNVSSSV